MLLHNSINATRHETSILMGRGGGGGMNLKNNWFQKKLVGQNEYPPPPSKLKR